MVGEIEFFHDFQVGAVVALPPSAPTNAGSVPLGRRSVSYNRFWTMDGEPCGRSDLTTVTVLADDGSDPDLTQASRVESKAFLRYEAWVILQVGNRVWLAAGQCDRKKQFVA